MIDWYYVTNCCCVALTLKENGVHDRYCVHAVSLDLIEFIAFICLSNRYVLLDFVIVGCRFIDKLLFGLEVLVEVLPLWSLIYLLAPCKLILTGVHDRYCVHACSSGSFLFFLLSYAFRIALCC